jgi:hypothetical protein
MDMQRQWDDTDSGKLKQCYSDHRTSHTDGPGIEPAVKDRQQEGGLYVFFWVIPRCLNFISRRFGTLYLFHLHRQEGE